MLYYNQVPPLVPEDFNSIPSDPNGCTQDLLCTVEEVADILGKPDPSKATGPDKISARMLKATAYSIAPSLIKLFNLSIKVGKLLSSWKFSNNIIVPIPKGGDPSSTSNYRPISLLSIISKCLETHIFNVILQTSSIKRLLFYQPVGIPGREVDLTCIVIRFYHS